MSEIRGPLPDIAVHTRNPEKMQSGWTLTNLVHRELGVPVTPVVIDSRGNVRWVYQHDDHTDFHGCVDVRSDPEGVLIAGAHGRGPDAYFPVLVSWEKEVVWEGRTAVDPHHMHRRENGNLIGVAKDHREVDGSALVSDDIVEIDPDAEFDELDPVPGWGSQTTWRWSLFDHVLPGGGSGDWSHANAVAEDGDGNLYLSARNLDSVFKIDRATGEIRWRLGEDGDFEMDDDARFYHQHAPEVQPNGNLLVFDNGAGRPGREYSRAVELAIDEESMEATAVWSWGEQRGLYTPIWGDADRLANGNTLITFGTRTHPKTSRLVEVTADGEVVWDAELRPSGWGMYRAERLAETVTDAIPHTA